MLYILALLIGVIAGLRATTAPATVAWGAWLGWLPLAGTWAGQAVPPLVGRLEAAGMSVALIERKFIGGTCVNTGCMPTKTMVASAYAAHLARRGADYGVALSGPIGVDYKKIKARKDKVTNDARGNLESWIARMKGCTLYRGHARFES